MSRFKLFLFFLLFFTVFLLSAPFPQESLFAAADPDRKPNIFVRFGKGITESVSGLFKKKKPVVVLPVENDPAGLPLSSPKQYSLDEPVESPVENNPVLQPVPATLPEYTRLLQRTILSYAALPKEAEGSGLSESVKVFFVIYPSGEIGRIFVPEKYRSRYGYLNEAAITAVRRASRQFPPFPPALRASKEKLFYIEILFEDNS